MDKVKAIIGLILGLASPVNIATGRAILTALVQLGVVRKDDGTEVTVDELDAIWDEAAANLRALGDEARASNARIPGDLS